MKSTLLLAAAAALVTAVLTDLIRRWVLARGLLDVPNERSAHTRPTPRGGGAAIVIVTIVAAVILCSLRHAGLRFTIALAGGGLAVAAIGWRDDWRSVGAATRLAVHFAAALWAICWLGGIPPLQIGDRLVDLGIVGDLLGLLGIVWTLNFFNFMDGIDGIAVTEAAFIAGAAVVLGAAQSFMVSASAVTLASACCGFLLFNWPPARIFLGDVGSGFLGFAISVMALASSRENPAALWVWLILTGTFFIDATVTLVRRVHRGEHAHHPHRNHAYQWLAHRWRSHERATMGALALNVFWLLPCAWFASRNPSWAAATVILALGPLVPLFVLLGSGRPEVKPFRAL
jgi:Fuc2NAc and GlcNAc transferase